MSDELVSVIVLSFNRKEETLRCLEAVTKQTYTHIELVVLDNGSTDGSAEAVALQYPQARLFRMPKNYGDWQGRDIAAMNCRGAYLMFLDNDAKPELDTIQRLVERIEIEPELAVIEAKVIDPNTGTPEGVGDTPALADIDHYKASFLGGASLIRSAAFRRVGGFPHYLLGGGEPFISYRLLDIGYRILHYSGTTIFHAKSSHERVPPLRYFLATKQRLRALMSHYPGVLRPIVELIWKSIGYAAGAIKRGYVFRLPWDLLRIIVSGLAEWRGPWRIRRETVNLVDYLRANVVRSASEYASIPVRRGQFGAAVRRRAHGFRIASKNS
jgi:GT2 family glycosyltransferase